jgi:hypothetical protein
MGTFTLRLSEVLDRGYSIWDTERPYPIFDELYREDLNQKIEEHFMFYEIGMETVGQFKFALNRKMREIMPLYNQLYKSEKLIPVEDALITMNMTHTGETTGDDTSTTSNETTQNSTVDANSRQVSSEFPQMLLEGDDDYATSGTDSASTTGTTAGGTASGTQTGHSSGTISNTTKGSAGHTAALLAQYRATFLNIDMLVIERLGILFMQVHDTQDEFSQNRSAFYGWSAYGWNSSI